MDLLTATLIAANLVSTAKNLWELTFMMEDDPAKERKFRIKSNYDFKNSQVRHFVLTTRGNRIIKLEPLD